MNIYHLQYFQTMAKLEHYTKAADILCITQPSLSNAISALEDELGVLLFEKRGRNVVLSKYGHVYLNYVENALRELKVGADKIKEMAQDIQAPINIGFIHTLSSFFIPRLVAGFKSENGYANVDFSLHEGCTQKYCTPELVFKLKRDVLDFIFISLIPKDPDIEFVKVCDQDLMVIVSDKSEIASNPSIDLSEIRAFPFINFAGKIGTKHEINRLFAQVGVIPNTCCEVDDELSMMGLVESNVGFAIVPFGPAIRNFNVKAIPLSNPRYNRPIYLGYMKNRKDNKTLESFKQFIINYSHEAIL